MMQAPEGQSDGSSTTNAAGAVYDTYLNNFKNQDGSVNWLPVCADAHGFVVNKDLFEKYDYSSSNGL